MISVRKIQAMTESGTCLEVAQEVFQARSCSQFARCSALLLSFSSQELRDYADINLLVASSWIEHKLMKAEVLPPMVLVKGSKRCIGTTEDVLAVQGD